MFVKNTRWSDGSGEVEQREHRASPWATHGPPSWAAAGRAEPAVCNRSALCAQPRHRPPGGLLLPGLPGASSRLSPPSRLPRPASAPRQGSLMCPHSRSLSQEPWQLFYLEQCLLHG